MAYGKKLRQKKFMRIFALVLVCLFIFTTATSLWDNTSEALGSASTLNVGDLWAAKRDSLGWCNSSNTPTTKMWQTGGYNGITENEDGTVTLNVMTAESYGDQLSNSLGTQLIDNTEIKELTTSDTVAVNYKYQGGNKPSQYSSVVSPTDSNMTLHYTIEYDTALVGYYRRYYVSTANQLAVLLYDYENATAQIMAQSSETEDETAGISKLGISLLCDIDLGGSNNKYWYGYKNQSFVLDFDGQGYTIYNGYFSGKDNCFLGRINKDAFDRKFSIRNVTFSHMFIKHEQGMFGGKSTGWAVEFAYFENVDFEYCMAVSSSGGTSIVLGGHYAYCYFKNCTVRNSYAKGNGHTSTFATYNPEEENSSKGTGTAVNHRTISYLGDTSEGITSYYYTSVPSLEEAERAWDGKTSLSEGYEDKILSKVFPTIYENCATIDCEIYDTLMDSGTFISCQSGFIIFKNCFTNSTMYGTIRTGVFLGSCMEASDGFYYELDGKREFTNSVFESCYSSGSIEGTMMIGGFVGSACNDDQGRQTKSSDRGKLIFNNCYTTSSVGLQYAGTLAIGGFVGDISGNSQNSSIPENEKAHIFKNCYVAGEVGNILTCTDTNPTGSETDTSTTNYSINDNNSVGGFMGTYNTTYDQMNVTNCYYDKQTTAMRERDIGCASKTGRYLSKNNSITGTTSTQLHGTLGITGAYTQTSEAKRVKGLTDTKDIMGKNNTAWSYTDGYYPQLSCFDEGKAYTKSYTYSSLSEKMEMERELLYYRCSLASTAAVFLDHYDEMLNESGESVSAIGEGVYDTVRDITSKFTFTSTCDDAISWKVDTDRNTSRSFASKMKSFTMNYKDGEDGTDYEKTYTPNVLVIDQDDDTGKYKCYDFAPGKQWVRVDIGGDSEFTGTRNLRLLPMAYLNAGNIITVKVSAENGDTTDETKWKNEVILIGSNNKTTTVDKFNHAYGVVYAITERARMLGTEYNEQKIYSYSDAKWNQSNDYFALYGGYTLESEMNNAVGLNDEGEMYAQNFSGLKEDSNQSSEGMTMVKIFTALPSADSDELKEGEELDFTDETLKSKWEGETPFDEDDAGYYYLKYYWRLNDGRYLEDSKLVYISTSTYHVEAVTGILNKKQTVGEGEIKSPIDQYVSSNQVTEEEVTGLYPSAQEGFTAENAADYYNNFTEDYTYNSAIDFDGESYYVKSTSLTATNWFTVVGWHKQNEYQMTTLIIEAHDANEDDWHEMARIDESDLMSGNNFSFDGAMYEYNFTSYSVTQNPETKVFSVETTTDNKVDFTVKSYSFGGTDSTDQYIEFAFNADNDVTLADINDDLRVTVLFRNTTANVVGTKDVLLESNGGTDDMTTVEKYAKTDGTAVSLKSGESYKSVNDTNLTGDSRKAVLPSDTLTYRVRLQNDGFNKAEDITVTDTVPDGTTLVDNSLRIYRQYKNITGKVQYGKLERLDNDKSSGCTANVDSDGTLTWTLPEITLEYDYYVEFKVKVDDISSSALSKTLENSADFDYHYHSGTAGSAFQINSIHAEKAYTLEFTNSDAIANGESSVTATGFSASYFETFNPNSYAVLTKTDENGNILKKWVVQLKSKGTNEVEIALNGAEAYDVTDSMLTNSELLSQASSLGETVTLSDEDMTLGDNEKLTLYIQDDNPISAISDDDDDEIIDEIDAWTSGTVSYLVGENPLSGSITKIEKETNQVETDVTWLYLNIKKEIAEYDPAQTFLIQIDYYADDTDEPTDTYYVTINCTEESTDSDGNTVYTGSRLIQCGKRGTYVVTELSDWSATDYDYNGAYSQEDSSSEKTKSDDKSVTVILPTQSFSSGAFKSEYGTSPLEKSPTVTFTSDESDYAYLSGQAYAENKIAG